MANTFKDGVKVNGINIFSQEGEKNKVKRKEINTAFKTLTVEASQEKTSADNLEFLSALHKLYLKKENDKEKQEPTPAELKEIYDKYIKPGAENKVKTSDFVLAEIQKAFDSPPPSLELFARSANEIMASMEENIEAKVKQKAELETKQKMEKTFKQGLKVNGLNIFSRENEQDKAKKKEIDEAYVVETLKEQDRASVDNIGFLSAVHNLYLKEPTPDELRKIYDTYIKTGDKGEKGKVEISDPVAAEFKAAYDNPKPGAPPPLELFASAANEIMASMQKNIDAKEKQKDVQTRRTSLLDRAGLIKNKFDTWRTSRSTLPKPAEITGSNTSTTVVPTTNAPPVEGSSAEAATQPKDIATQLAKAKDSFLATHTNQTSQTTGSARTHPP